MCSIIMVKNQIFNLITLTLLHQIDLEKICFGFNFKALFKNFPDPHYFSRIRIQDYGL